MPARHVHQRIRWYDFQARCPKECLIEHPCEVQAKPGEAPPKADTDIEITYPEGGQEVSSPVTVTGTVTGALGDITVVVTDLSTGFPQATPPSVSGSGPWTWSATFYLGPGPYRVDASSSTAACTDTDSVLFSVV